jgi:hypothetical protein
VTAPRHSRRSPGFRRSRRSLYALTALASLTILAASVAATDTRTVKLNISVIDAKDKDIAGATVVVTPEGGSAVTVQTDEKGSAVAVVTVSAAKFGEGWLRSAPVLRVVATKDSVSSQNSVTVRPKDFKDGKTAELPCTIVLKAPPPAVTARLTVTVKDELGNAVSGARVNVYQSGVVADRIVVPPTSQEPTNAQGQAHLTFPVPAGTGLDISLEVGREDMASQSRPLSFPAPVPANLPEQSFVLKKRTASGGTDVISVVVTVQSEGKPLEGASVLIRDDSLGAKTGRFAGVTDSAGRVTIAVWYATPSASEKLPVEVSKNGYKNANGSVALNKKDIGKTIAGPGITLEKQSTSGTVVTVNVLDVKSKEPIGGAQVTLDGPDYLYDNTNASGVVSFVVPKAGTFEVRVTEENHRPFKGQVRVRTNEQDKAPVVCEMEAKVTKDEGKDVIDVTVLGKDTTDEKSKPAPVKGATVRAGRITVVTDETGKAKLQGAFEEKQEVVVDASGYKSQRKAVHVGKALHYFAGQGAATFTLEPELSENSPIRIIVEVVDTAGVKIDDAGVEFSTAAGAPLWGNSTKKVGRVDFRSSDVPNIPIAELRKGILVTVRKSPGYKEVLNRSVPSNLLQPSLQAGTYQVQLERDWTELESALAVLEARASALKNEAAAVGTKIKMVDAAVSKFPAAKGRVESILAELKKAQQVFDPKVAGQRCQEVAELVKEINGLQTEARQKEEGLKKTLDEAIGLAANCKTRADGDVIKTKHRDAIKSAGEIGKLGNKAAEANRKLTRMAETMKEGGKLDTELQQTLERIEGEAETAKKESASAYSQFNDAFVATKEIGGKRAALLAELTQLKTKFELSKNDKLLPPQLKTRLTTLEQLISGISAPPPSNTRLDEVMKPVLADLDKFVTQARGIVSGFKRAICDVQPMNAVVEEINTRVTGATIELGAAGDLPSKADICIAKAAASPAPTPVPSPTLAPSPTASATPSPSDEVTVPDVSGAGNDPKAMKAAAGPDMVGVIMATKASPSPGSTKLFASQSPAPNTKAKRGSILKIFVYQSLAQATPTPSPTASVGASPSATPSASPSATRSPGPGGGTMPDLFGKTLEQAVGLLPSNMRIQSDEVGDKPPSPEKAFTIFAQTPAAGSTFDPKKPPVVTVKRYGSAKAEAKPKERFDGTYIGSYSGGDSGAVRFSVSGGTIAITSPGRGTGQISASGSASISGSGADGASSYTFSGTFTVGADGKASAAGRWTGQQSGFTGRGTWSASRR